MNAFPWLTEPLNQWRSARQMNRLGHALLIQGPKGVGKGELAEQIGKELLCQHQNGCGQCRSCLLLSAGNHPDKYEIKPDGTQIKVDAIRELIGSLSSTAHQSGARVVVIHQAQRMNVSASNSLLKTLEEPPANVFLLLLADQASTLLPTIVSRCLRIPVSMPTEAQLNAYVNDARINQWRYWSRVIGGPLALKVAIESNQFDTLLQWQQAWRDSLRDGLLASALTKVKAEEGELALKLFYYELLDRAQQPELANSLYPLLNRVSENILRLQRQSGINLSIVFQALLTEYRNIANKA